ncbi:hypothetical protein TNCV_4952901 [Trichonephila clavipes]|nr:hypothetical protein TNCV_4952901 [Trichonephila clavipes]
MVTSEQKAFCVLQFAKTELAITVQRVFHIKFGCQHRGSSKLNIFCAIPRRKVYVPFVLGKPNVTGSANLMLYNHDYFLNWKGVNQIISFGSKMVYHLTGTSQL